MMAFDGSSYYNKAVTSTTNQITTIARFNSAEWTGGAVRYVNAYQGPSTDLRIALVGYPSDHATTALRNKLVLFSQSSASVTLCLLASLTNPFDSENHTVFGSFDADNALSTYFIDGIDADDTGNGSRIAPTVGVLSTGALGDLYTGANAGANYWTGEVGLVGVEDRYLTNPLDFMDSQGNPLEIDESGWTEWGSDQPLAWNQHGEMTNNLGDAAPYTENGTITVGKGGN